MTIDQKFFFPQLAVKVSDQTAQILSNLNGSNIFGTWKFVRDTGSSFQPKSWGLIMTPAQEANGDNLGIIFDLLHNNSMLSTH